MLWADLLRSGTSLLVRSTHSSSVAACKDLRLSFHRGEAVLPAARFASISFLIFMLRCAGVRVSLPYHLPVFFYLLRIFPHTDYACLPDPNMSAVPLQHTPHPLQRPPSAETATGSLPIACPPEAFRQVVGPSRPGMASFQQPTPTPFRAAAPFQASAEAPPVQQSFPLAAVAPARPGLPGGFGRVSPSYAHARAASAAAPTPASPPVLVEPQQHLDPGNSPVSPYSLGYPPTPLPYPHYAETMHLSAFGASTTAGPGAPVGFGMRGPEDAQLKYQSSQLGMGAAGYEGVGPGHRVAGGRSGGIKV
ncbi:hypothetical protein B0H10DRAFT_636389 [Mycena sp. CBHHK59/15]|nr:hypothetical protein B0H10DRAFT_636389 [Mycena sp. CBHHK59/15]